MPQLLCFNQFWPPSFFLGKTNPPLRILGPNSLPRTLTDTRIAWIGDTWKWFRPASRNSPNPPGPWEKAKQLLLRIRFVYIKTKEHPLVSLLINLKGPTRKGPAKGNSRLRGNLASSYPVARHGTILNECGMDSSLVPCFCASHVLTTLNVRCLKFHSTRTTLWLGHIGNFEQHCGEDTSINLKICIYILW